MCAGSNAAEIARQDQLKKDTQIRLAQAAVNKQYEGFNEPFYAQRAQDYTAYAMPELNRQFQTQRYDLLSGLGNRGLLQSSVAQDRANKLNAEMTTQKQNVVDTGLARSQALRQDVEQSRSNLINQAVSTADPTLAARSALSSAQSFQAPSTFTPLSNMFSNWMALYALKQQQQDNNAVYDLIRQYNQSTPSAGGTMSVVKG